MSISLKHQSDASVQTPSTSGHSQLFVGTDGNVKIKNSSGGVRTIEGSGGGSTADGTHSYLEDETIEVAVNNSYIVEESCIFIFPSAENNLGRRLSITIQEGSTSFLTLSGQQDYLITADGEGLSRPVELCPIEAGQYEFRAMSLEEEPDDGRMGWVMFRMAGTFSRKSIDVDYCMAGNFPTGFAQTTVGGDRWYVAGGEEIPPRDFNIDEYNAGRTVLVPFEQNASLRGLYLVREPVGNETWRWEMIGFPGAANNAAEYRIVRGETYAERIFRTNPPSDMSDAYYYLVPKPLRYWPPGTTNLTGVEPNDPENPWPNGETYVHGPDQLLTGKINRIALPDDAGDIPFQYHFTLDYPGSFGQDLAVGERFGLKFISMPPSLPQGEPATIRISLPNGTIEDPLTGSINGSECEFTVSAVSYFEWQLDYGRTWRSVTVPSVGGGGGGSTTLTLAEGEPETTNFVAQSWRVHRVDISAEDLTVTLPSLQSPNTQIVIKLSSSAGGHTCTIDGGGSTIDGEPTLVLATDYEWASLMSDGTNWVQIS